MIVTRRRKRRANPLKYVIPFAVIAIAGFLLGYPPSQRAIVNGPLQPLSRPLTFAGQQQTIADRNRELRDLSARLEAARRAKDDADRRAADLQQQLVALRNQTPVTPAPAPRPVATSAAPGLAAGMTASAAGPSDDEKRLAATWAAMEPEKAAAVAQHFPDAEVSRVLGAMDPDTAGAIMDALPPAVAVRISRAVAQVPPARVR